MRLLPHVLLAYLALGLQLGLDGLLTLRAAGGYGKVDLVYAAAAGIVAMLPKPSGPTAALVIGLAHDLATSGPVGPRAVGYGLAGLLIAVCRAADVRPASSSSPRPARSWPASPLTSSCSAAGGAQTAGGASLSGFMTALLTIALAWPLWKLRGRLVLSERRM